jgi:hypothetical protein
MNCNEPHSINQHYVPKLLLKKFSSKESFVWVYDKEAQKKNWNFIKERPINKVASEDYFYDKVKNVKEESYEYELRKIETEVAPILEKIIQFKNLSILSEIEREKISRFVMTQHIRTKFRQSEVKNLTDDLNDKLKQKLKTTVDLNIDSKHLWFSMFEDVKIFSKFISNKIWFLGKSDRLFFSSDNPVVLQNVTDQNPFRGNLGFDSYGIEIYLPLNDSLILCMYCEKTLNIENDSIIDFNYQNVLNVNSLQYFQSERFVISSQNNFEMIKEY